jgi:hypothetical protein
MVAHLLFIALVALASSAGAQDHSGHNTFTPIPAPRVEGQATPVEALAAVKVRPVAAASRAPAPRVQRAFTPVAPALGSPVRQVPPAPRRGARRGVPRGVPRVSNVYRSAYLEMLRLGDKRREAGDVKGAAAAYAAVLQILPENPAAMIALRSLSSARP